jgi:hypothetical protein
VAWRAAWLDCNKQPLSPAQGKRIAKPLLGRSSNHRIQHEERMMREIEEIKAEAKALEGRVRDLEHELVRNKLPVPPWNRPKGARVAN